MRVVRLTRQKPGTTIERASLAGPQDAPPPSGERGPQQGRSRQARRVLVYELPLREPLRFPRRPKEAVPRVM
jgi:hypothetical protein